MQRVIASCFWDDTKDICASSMAKESSSAPSIKALLEALQSHLNGRKDKDLSLRGQR